MFVLIRGAGDIATGIALRLWRSGMQVAMLDLPNPTAIRRTVCFSPALRFGTQKVEDVTAKKATSTAQVPEILAQGCIPVLADPEGESIPILKPDVLVGLHVSPEYPAGSIGLKEGPANASCGMEPRSSSLVRRSVS